MTNLVTAIINMRSDKNMFGQCNQILAKGVDTYYVDAQMIRVNESKRFYQVSLNKEISGMSKKVMMHKGVIADNVDSEDVLTALINYYRKLTNEKPA